MEQLKLDELKIATVTHTELDHHFEKFRIEFFIDAFQYGLYMEEFEDGKLHPTKIVHWGNATVCNYCKESRFSCRELSKHKQELFHRLIQFPSIRLEWLYIDHV